MRTEPIMRINAADPPFPATDTETSLASAFQQSMKQYSEFEEELAPPHQIEKEESGPALQTEYLNDNRPGLLARIVEKAKTVWNYLFGQA
jgi:hypothetical protein